MSKMPDYNWQPYGQPPPRRNRGPVLVVLLILGGLGSVFLIAFVGIVIAIASMESQFGDLAFPGNLESDAPAQPSDWQQARRAYDPDASKVDAKTLAKIQPLIDEFVRCSNDSDLDGLRKIVDYKRFFRDVKDTRFAPDVALYDQAWLQRQHCFALNPARGSVRLFRCRLLS